MICQILGGLILPDLTQEDKSVLVFALSLLAGLCEMWTDIIMK